MTDPEMAGETPEITLSETERRGRYTLRHADGRDSELTFVMRGGAMAIDHTFTPRDLRGEGAALALLKRAVSDARERQLKVIPVCPYLALQFRRHPDWADLLR